MATPLQDRKTQYERRYSPMRIDRLPAIPLIASDPYFSVWMPSDQMTLVDTIHWCGQTKPIRMNVKLDDKCRVSCLGYNHHRNREAVLKELVVTPTATRFVEDLGGVELAAEFVTPALPDDPDLMSMPVTLVTVHLRNTDVQPHQVQFRLSLMEQLCYEGISAPRMMGDVFQMGDVNVGLYGQMQQKPLCHSGDHITIDWGYLYLASPETVQPAGGLNLEWEGLLEGEKTLRAVIAYDDIASINYFGDLCKAWYRRNGAQITDAISFAWTHFDSILARCRKLDADVLAEAGKVSADYQTVVSASWRQTIAAHKLIATPKGEMAFISKENDSNGCAATADVSYPSIPLFLKYNPELVNAMARPILEFAAMPVWTDDFAPHDVGRYPCVLGQVYAAKRRRDVKTGDTHPPYYLYPAGADVYDHHYQMPVEECGNMLVMLAAAQHFGASRDLAEQYRDILAKWVQYLIRYGEDPGDQLCTDDFAGHLAHNVNLSAKAMVGVACYGRLTGESQWEDTARQMAQRFLDRFGCEGNTPLTIDGAGWSQKYNLLWDKVLKLGLLPDSFYAAETASYIPRMNGYGLPLDSRADYTKSDWICWCAAMAEDPAVRAALIAPIARMLRESPSRVPFSDWYDTKTGNFMKFIARSVQGGVFAPFLTM